MFAEGKNAIEGLAMVRERRSLFDVLTEEGAKVLDDLVWRLTEIALHAELDECRHR